MNFEEVLPALREGKRVRRALWKETDFPFIGSWLEKVGTHSLPDGRLVHSMLLIWSAPAAMFINWGGYQLDIQEDDWEILK